MQDKNKFRYLCSFSTEDIKRFNLRLNLAHGFDGLKYFTQYFADFYLDSFYEAAVEENFDPGYLWASSPF